MLKLYSPHILRIYGHKFFKLEEKGGQIIFLNIARDLKNDDHGYFT